MGKYAGWIIGALAAVAAYFIWRSMSGASAALGGSDSSSGWDIGATPGYNVSPGLSAPIGGDQPALVPTPTGDLPAAPPKITAPSPNLAPSTAPPKYLPPLPPDVRAAPTLITSGISPGSAPQSLPTGAGGVPTPFHPVPVPTPVAPAAPAIFSTGPTIETRRGAGHF
jgi:hypothetical protein